MFDEAQDMNTNSKTEPMILALFHYQLLRIIALNQENKLKRQKKKYNETAKWLQKLFHNFMMDLVIDVLSKLLIASLKCLACPNF